MFDLIIKNARVCDAGTITEASLAIQGGKIAALYASDAALPEAEKTVDANHNLLMPGMVDMHFHCRVPGHSEREDFDTATMAASHGGVTTLAEMPIAKPSPHDAETFRRRVEHASSRAVIDFAFYGAGATMDPQKASVLAKEGAIGFKFFLHRPPVGREDEFMDLCAPDNSAIFKSLSANATTGLITCVHAEDDMLIQALCEYYKDEDQTSEKIQMLTRPSEAEELAVCNAAILSRITKARLHICHVSSKNAADAIRFLKKSTPLLTAESCPHYMLMDTVEMEKHGTLAKVNPPLRDETHRNALIAALHDGTLDAISSDHAPFLLAEKQVDNFLAAPSGMPGIEFFGPSLWDAVKDGKWTYPELVHFASEMPARLLGIYPKKGALLPGSDADFILVDPDAVWTPTEEELFTKSHSSALPYLGRSYQGRLLATYVRGTRVYEAGRITAPKGCGRFVPGPCYEPKR